MRWILASAAERLKKYIKDNAYTIALAIDGKQYSSEDFSAHVHDLGLKGESHLQLIIGGSIGLAPEILSLAQEKISFSKMTFPHDARDLVGADLPGVSDHERGTIPQMREESVKS